MTHNSGCKQTTEAASCVAANKVVTGFVALMAGLACATAFADSFQWVHGQERDVCRAYKSYIEIADKHAAAAERSGKARWDDRLMCARKVTPPAELEQPIWRETTPDQHLPLMRSVRMNIARDLAADPAIANNKRYIKTTEGAVLENFRRGADKWLLAEADIDNDGRTDRLVKYKMGPCNDYPPDSLRYSVVIMVVAPEDNAIHTTKSRQLVLGGARGAIRASVSSMDVFSFRGKTYVDIWRNEGESDGRATTEQSLSVYLNEGDRRSLVCAYRPVAK